MRSDEEALSFVVGIGWVLDVWAEMTFGLWFGVQM